MSDRRDATAEAAEGRARSAALEPGRSPGYLSSSQLLSRGAGEGRFVPGQPIVELKAPPSSSKFWPTMKPEEAAHRKAQASPNSTGSPTRPVGFVEPRLASISSN